MLYFLKLGAQECQLWHSEVSLPFNSYPECKRAPYVVISSEIPEMLICDGKCSILFSQWRGVPGAYLCQILTQTDPENAPKCPRYIGNVIIYWVKPVMGKSWRGVVFLCFCLPFLFPPIYSLTLQCHNIVQEVCGCPRNQASKEAQCQSSRLLPVWLHILVILQSGVEFFTCSLCATEYREMWELQVWVQNSFDRFDLQQRFRFLIPAFLRRLEQHIKDDMSDHPLTYTKM